MARPDVHTEGMETCLSSSKFYVRVTPRSSHLQSLTLFRQKREIFSIDPGVTYGRYTGAGHLGPLRRPKAFLNSPYDV